MDRELVEASDAHRPFLVSEMLASARNQHRKTSAENLSIASTLDGSNQILPILPKALVVAVHESDCFSRPILSDLYHRPGLRLSFTTGHDAHLLSPRLRPRSGRTAVLALVREPDQEPVERAEEENGDG